jgi:hypothetical protein
MSRPRIPDDRQSPEAVITSVTQSSYKVPCSILALNRQLILCYSIAVNLWPKLQFSSSKSLLCVIFTRHMYRKYQRAELIYSIHNPSLKKPSPQMDTPITHNTSITIPLTECANELYGKHYSTSKWAERDWWTGHWRGRRHFECG